MDLRVGYAGSRTRYPVGMYEYVHKKSGRHANLSGTAIMILLPPQSFSGAVFLLSYLPVQIPNPIHTSFKEWQMSLKKY